MPPFAVRGLYFLGIDAAQPFALGVVPFGIDACALAVRPIQFAVDEQVGLDRISASLFQRHVLARRR